MANKPFSIQESKLRIAGVDLEAGNTTIVIPGVTQATTYQVEEVDDTGDQTQTFTQTVAVIDYVTYQEIVNQTGNGSGRADYITELDGNGYIDDLEVGGRGTYTSAESSTNAANNMYAYIGTSSASDRPIVPQHWVQIPFRPKMRAKDIETIGGGSGGAVVERGVSFPLGEEGDQRGTIALTPDGETYVCTDDWTDLTEQYQGEYVGENITAYDVGQSGGELNMVIFSASAEPELLFILQHGNWSVGDIIIDAGEEFGGPQIVQFAGSGNVDMSFSWTHRTGVDPTTIAVGHQATITYNGTIYQQPIWRRLVDLTGGSGGENGDGTINWTSTGDLTIETIRPDGYTDDCDLNLYAADDVFITANGDEVDITANTNVVIESDDGNHQWKFAQDGSLKMPYHTNTGYQSGYSLDGPTLLLGGENDPTQQVIITGPVPNNDNSSAQRLVIQGQKGWGGEGQNKGEGGDVYIWAGVGGDGGAMASQGNGGDVKVRGGQGGAGGYVKVEGGDATGPGGTGGQVEITAGDGTNVTSGDGGDVIIKAGSGSGTGNNGEVNIYTVGTTNHWTFKNDGALEFPDGSRQTTAYPGDATAAYKGFSATFGRMYTDTPTISKIVIYKDSISPTSTIDTSTSNDDFSVTGLTGSDVVAMFVIMGADANNPESLNTLRAFARAAIDNVILNNGDTGDIRSISSMRSAFYSNYATLASAAGTLYNNFEFYKTNLSYSGSLTGQGSGSGFAIGSIDINSSGAVVGASFNNSGTGYQIGDVFTLLGADIQGGTTPTNNLTFTITDVGGSGEINNGTWTGTAPTTVWPANAINDGGDDQYDTANYIDTNLDTEISYNDGNVANDAAAFGGTGADYVMVYQASIFAVLVTGASISTIGTSGNSGFDGDGIADTGTLLYPASSPAQIVGDGAVAQVGGWLTYYTDAYNLHGTGGATTSIVMTAPVFSNVGDQIHFQTGDVRTITSIEVDTPDPGLSTINWTGAVDNMPSDPLFPIKIYTADYVAEVKPTARIKPDTNLVSFNQYMDIYTGQGPSNVDDAGHIHMKGHTGNIELFLGTDDNFVSSKEAGTTPGHVSMRSENDIKVIETNLRTTRNGSTFFSDMGDNLNYDWYRGENNDLVHGCVAVDDDGNYYVGGEHCWSADAIVSKFDKDGSLLWSKKVNDAAWKVTAIAVDPVTNNAGVVFASDVGRSNTYAKLVEFDQDGNVESTWTDYHDMNDNGTVEINSLKKHPTLGWVLAGRASADDLTTVPLSPQTGSGVGRLVLNAAATDIYGALMNWTDTSWYVSGTNISGRLQLSDGIGLFRALTPTNVVVANPSAGGAAIDVRISYTGSAYYGITSVTTAGTNYTVGDTIKILGSQVGGVDGVNDTIFTIDAVDGSGGIVSAPGPAGAPVLDVISIDMGILGYSVQNFSTGTYTVYKEVATRPVVITDSWKRLLNTQEGYNYGHARSLDFDSNGNIYVGGYVNGSWNGTAGTNFVWKLDSSGATGWIRGNTGDYGEVKSIAVASDTSIFALSYGNGTVLTKYLDDGSASKTIVPSGPWGGTPHIDTAIDDQGEEYLYVGWGSYGNIGSQASGMLVQKFTLGLEHVWSRELYLTNLQGMSVDYEDSFTHFALTNKQAAIVGYSQAMGNYNDNAYLASISITDDFVNNTAGENGVYAAYTDWQWQNQSVSIENLATDLTPFSSTITKATDSASLSMYYYTWPNRVLNGNATSKGIVGVENVKFIQGGDLKHNPADVPLSDQNLQVDDNVNWNITLKLSDRGKFIKNMAAPYMGSVQDLEVFIPKSNDVAFPVGTIITLVNLDGNGTYKINVTPAGYGDSDAVKLWASGDANHSKWGFAGIQTATLMKIGTDDWLLTANNIVNND